MNKYTYNLGQLFDQIVYSCSQNVAVRLDDNIIFTYSELDILSNKIAHLIQSKNVHKGDVVAIFSDKNIYSYATMLACLKLGVIYTNLDSNSPTIRLKRMIEISTPKLMFLSDIEKNSLEFCDFSFQKTFQYSSNKFQTVLEQLSSQMPIANVSSIDPAYLMFTSGSTGFPKGVVITHGNVINFVNWVRQVYQIDSNDILTNINPMHFDNSVFDFYGGLFTGASIISIQAELLQNPRRLIDKLNILKPTVWFSVPSMLVFMLKMRSIKQNDLNELRILSFGGEGFPKNQLRNLWNLWGDKMTFLNVYGPTECTCICSSYIVKNKDLLVDDLLPIGTIAENFDYLILDEKENEVGESEIGELYIRGENVGLGYFNDLEKTNSSFIQNPKNKSYRDIVYKTGDLVRFDKNDQLLYFCGRIDNQIKRMGYRIELEEIENALNTVEFIQESAVIYHKTEFDNGNIIACLVSLYEDEPIITGSIDKLIPSYMLPDKFVFYDHLPKNQNGKIDRIKLKENYLHER